MANTMPASSTATSGPTAAHLAQNDKQLQSLEAAVQQLQHDHQTHTKNIDRKVSHIEQQLYQQSEDTKNAFVNLRPYFETTLTQALTQQDSRISASLEDLKQIFLRHDKRSFLDMEDDQ